MVKYCLLLAIKNKARILSLTTITQHRTENSIHCNKTKIGNKRYMN